MAAADKNLAVAVGPAPMLIVEHFQRFGDFLAYHHEGMTFEQHGKGAGILHGARVKSEAVYYGRSAAPFAHYLAAAKGIYRLRRQAKIDP